MTSALVPHEPTALPVAAPKNLRLRRDPLDRLPGTRDDDPFERLAAAWLLGIAAPKTARAYRLDLTAWANWYVRAGVHPPAAERFHVDAYKTWLSTTPSSRTSHRYPCPVRAGGVLLLRRERRGAVPLPRR